MIAAAVAFVLVWVGFLLGQITENTGKIDLKSYRGGVSYVQVRQSCLHSDRSGCPSFPVNADTLREACQLYTDAGMNRLDGYPDKQSFLQGCSDQLSGVDDRA